MKNLASRVLGIAIASFFADSSFGARVEYIDPRLNFAIIDKGIIHGIISGSNICVLDEKQFIISCGGVVLVNRTKAAIRLPLEEMKKIQIGGQVSIKEIYLKDEASPYATSDELPVFRPARMRPSTLPPTISYAAEQKELELGGANGPPPQPGYVDSNSNNSASESISGPIVEQDAKDPYADIDRLSDVVRLPDSSKSSKKLTWKELKKRIVFRAFTVETQALYPLIPAALFKAPAFATIPANNPVRPTMWDQRDLKKKPKTGVSLQLGFMNPQEINYNFGWRYYQKVIANSESKMDARFPQQIAQTAIDSESMGLWAQRLWRFKPLDFLFTDLGFGGDFNVSDISFKSFYDSVNPSSDPLASGLIANARSRIATFSLRGSIAQVIKISRFNISLALSLYTPLVTANTSFQANAKAPAGNIVSSDPEDDLQKAIDHRKNKMASDLHFGIGSQF